MTEIPYLQTSVFVDARYGFGGNQLATYWNAKLNTQLTTELMQGMTLEMNFSESTFIEPPSKEGNAAKVRIFTPARELKFAGHPTIGSAFVLREMGIVDKSVHSAILELGIGPIPVEYLEDGSIRMTQNEPEFLDILDDKYGIASALQISSSEIDTRAPMQWVSTGFPFLMVPVKTLDIVKEASPISTELLSVLKGKLGAQVVLFSTDAENDDSHVHARMFGPEVGVVEDPATGSAAGPLAAYIEQYDLLGRDERGQEIVIEQGYEIKRPSKLIAQVIGKNDFKGVYVRGWTRVVAKGVFFIDI